MKKLLIVAIMMTVLLSLIVVPAVLAAGKDGQAGKSNVGHLYLYQKDSSTWQIVPGGAWGKMTYNLAGPTFDYVFNGHKLSPNTGYSLIYYADPWPGNKPGALIANGTSNSDGNVNLVGSVELNTDLPNAADANYPGGAKIWLVLSSDYNSALTKMVGWTPTKYLFENNLITYDDVP